MTEGLPSTPGLLQLPLSEFLDRLASDAPTPGGGAAAALAAAAGAALVSMVCRLTLGRPKYTEVQGQARAILERAEALRVQAERGVEADAQAYEGVAAAFRLPRDTEAQQAARAEVIQRASREACQPPLELAADCAELLHQCEAGAGILTAAAISDIEVAAMLGLAALHSAAANVEINLKTIRDEDFLASTRQRLTQLKAGRDGQVQRIVAMARGRS